MRVAFVVVFDPFRDQPEGRFCIGQDGAAGIIVTSSGSVISDPAPVLDRGYEGEDPALVLDLAKRIDITLRAGHRLSVEGRFDLAAILALARGLEAIR